MSLNLWKIGGQPTAFNPLLIGWVNFISVGYKEYVVRFNAKSQSSATLRVADTDSSDFNYTQVLTSEFKSYEFVCISKSTQNLYLYDQLSRGDIVIQNIEVIEKPLPKLTINGVDGFLSGKWVISANANAVIIDNETLEINPTLNYVTNYYRVPIGENQLVSIAIEDVVQGAIYPIVECKRADDTTISSFIIAVGSKSRTFTTPSGTTQMWFILTSSTAGKFTFKKPMLNLGSIPAPYEKKRGERMVLPQPKKNLANINSPWLYVQATKKEVDGYLVSDNGAYGGYAFDFYAEKDKTYTISFMAKSSDNSGYYDIGQENPRVLGLFGSNTSLNLIQNDSEQKKTITFTSDRTGLLNFKLLRNNLSGAVYYRKDTIMIEEGATATPYEPYSVQLNPKPKVIVPKKNIFNKNVANQLDGSYRDNAGTVVSNATTGYTRGFYPVQGSKQYVISGNAAAIYCYDVNKAWISRIVSISNGSVFTVPSNCAFIDIQYSPPTFDINVIQIEEGSTATIYEPYQLVLPRSESGLIMDGTINYLQLPSMTMDSVEIDCLIDSVQVVGATMFQTLIGTYYGKINGSISTNTTVSVNGVSTSGALSTGSRNKIKYTFPSVTDGLRVFINSAGLFPSKGTLYGVKCYLNGAVVAEYDFTKPNNIVSATVLQRASNLIPSFEDTRWQIHANADVMGKDVLRLEATGSWQFSTLIVPVLPSQKYLFGINTNGMFSYMFKDSVGTDLVGFDMTGLNYFREVTSPINAVTVRIRPQNSVAGTFDFIKPQLYQLDGKEGTLLGSPQPQKKASKRTLYSRR